MKKITVIGAGFAALSAVRKLRQLDATAEITVIAPKPEMIYLPSLIWIPSGKRRAQDKARTLGKVREADTGA